MIFSHYFNPFLKYHPRSIGGEPLCNMKLILLFISICSILIIPEVHGQELEKVPPVSTKYKCRDTTTSFVLNTLDFHNFGNQGHARYSNTIQIVDADAPWPPRWFSSLAIFDNDSIKRADQSQSASRMNVMMDVRFQNGGLTFYKERSVIIRDNKEAEVAGYIICNSHLDPVDTLQSKGQLTVDCHDFRINEKKEKLILLKMDTVLDLRKISGKPQDSKVPATINIIQVRDSANKVLFSWNPVRVLGVNALYYPYKNTITYTASKKQNIDWSHGTSVSWDFDGDILYNFRFIGIGKISGKDGHVIWRMDRNNMPIIHQTDTLEFYSQHDFEKVSENNLYTTYSVFSNGEKDKESFVLEFRVSKKNGEIQKLKKIKPEKKIFSSGWGNYEKDEMGNYLLNYGQYLKDTGNSRHIFMEYRNRNDGINSKYELPAGIFSYKVHFLKDNRPPRPEIIQANGMLTIKGDMKEWTWYRLSGAQNTEIEKVGEGSSYAPKNSGLYCVVGKYGIGYSASRVFEFGK